jgi:hypothetical protein
VGTPSYLNASNIMSSSQTAKTTGQVDMKSTGKTGGSNFNDSFKGFSLSKNSLNRDNVRFLLLITGCGFSPY